MKRFACVSCLVAGLVSRAEAQVSPTFPDVVFATLGPKDLKLDVYIPTTGSSPYPLVVYIHGGGWAAGAKAPLAASGEALLLQGIAVASIEYRLTTQAGQYGSFPVIFPAQIHDVKGAIRFLRANASTYNFDTSRFGVLGQSAGAHLAALAAVSCGASALEGNVGGNTSFSSCVDVGGGYYGIYDFYNIADDALFPPSDIIDHDDYRSIESALFGWDQIGQGLGDIKANWTNPNPPYPALVQLVLDATPVNWVDASDPPMFFIHGTADPYVPIEQSARLSAALFNASVWHEYRGIPGLVHRPPPIPTQDALVEFFTRFFSTAGLPPVAGAQVCAGVGGACPCSNDSLAGAEQGCRHSLVAGGKLIAQGAASISADTLVLRANSMTGPTALFVQSDMLGAPAFLGDGVSCLQGTIVRLRTVNLVDGASELPEPTGAAVSVLGGVQASTSYLYQAEYRNSASYCTSSTLNWTSGVLLTWVP